MKRLIKSYFSEDRLRHELNVLTREVYDFDFEAWFQSGGYTGDYDPYSFEENGRILSNASANRMRFVHGGKEKNYIQIGTVMTAKDCRNKGYARALITKILEDYKEGADGFYLFSNLNAVGFYEKMGFQRGMQYRYSLKRDVTLQPSGRPFEKVNREDAILVNQYKDMIRHAAVHAEFDLLNSYGLLMFYTADMKQVYYSEDLDCFICLETERGVFYLNSIISRGPINMKAVLERIPVGGQSVVLGFAPLLKDRELFDAREYDGEDDYRFLFIGEDLECVEKDQLFFPVLSHA